MSRSIGGSSLTTFSSIEICPEVMLSRPATMRKVVVLPQPDGPTSTTNSWSRMSRLTSMTAWTSSYFLLRLRIATRAMILSLYRPGDAGDVILDKERIDERDRDRAQQRTGHQLAPEEHVAALEGDALHHLPGGDPRHPVGRDFRLHLVVERVHLRAGLPLLARAEDRAGRGHLGTGARRRVLLGRADGRCAAGLDPGRVRLFVLCRVLRLRHHRVGKGIKSWPASRCAVSTRSTTRSTPSSTSTSTSATRSLSCWSRMSRLTSMTAW